MIIPPGFQSYAACLSPRPAVARTVVFACAGQVDRDISVDYQERLFFELMAVFRMPLPRQHDDEFFTVFAVHEIDGGGPTSSKRATP